jgi:hypothetical protein
MLTFKRKLTHLVGSLDRARIAALDRALSAALEIGARS